MGDPAFAPGGACRKVDPDNATAVQGQGQSSKTPPSITGPQASFGNAATANALTGNLGGIEPQSCPKLPDGLPTTTEVELPVLDVLGRFAGPTKLTFAVIEPAQSKGYTWYAVPISAVVSELEAAGNVCEATQPDNDRLRRTLGLPAIPGVPATPARPQSQPGIKGDPTGLGILELRGDYAITGTYTKFAVGAASVGVIETRQGVALVDAGVGPKAQAELTQHVLGEIEGILKGRPITEVLITHLHADHTNLLPELAARFQIGTIRVNALQRLDARMIDILEKTARAQSARIDREVRAKAEANRAAWEADAGSGEIKTDQPVREAAWKQHVDDLVKTEQAKSGITLETLIPHEGKFHVVKSAMTEKMVLPGGPGEPVLLKQGYLEVDPVTGNPRISTSNPEIATDIRDQLKLQEKNPKAGVRNEKADANETTFVIQLKGARMFVLPDKRAGDIKKIKDILKADVERLNEALKALGKPQASLTTWEMSHHMQKGFATTVTQMETLVQNLQDLVRVADASGKTSVDVVVVSGHGDPSKPGAKSLIDPAMVLLLRECGIQVYVATGDTAIRLIEVLTPSGKTIAGLTGEAFQGEIPSQAILRQSESAQRFVEQQMKELRTNRPKHTKGGDFAEHTRLNNEHKAKMSGLRELLKNIVDQRKEYMDSFTKELRPAKGKKAAVKKDPKVNAERTRLAREALQKTLTDPRLSSVPVEAGPSANVFDPVALTLLNEPPGGLTADQKAVADALVKADRLRTNLRAMDSLVGRAEFTLHLGELSKLLAEYVKKAPPGTKEVLLEELKLIDAEIKRLTTPTAESGHVTSQISADGRYRVEQRVQVEGKNAAATRRVQKLMGMTERPMGALMVYTMFHKLDQTADAYKDEQLNLPQALVGTATSFYGISIGVRMMVKVPVGLGPFAILTVLDIVDTGIQSYDSPEARYAAITNATVRGGLQLGLTALSTYMIATGHPYVAAAGFILQFAVDPLLNKLGFYEWVERKWDFLPDDVKKVEQRLRKLIQEYTVVVGLLDLSDRDLSKIPAWAVKKINEEKADRLKEVTEKEADVLEAFADGYKEAEKSYAGLIELDNMRAQFVQLQFRAHKGDPNVSASRTKAIQAFQNIEKTLGDESWTKEQVEGLPQWVELNKQLNELEGLVAETKPDWEDVLKREKRVNQVLGNARYRISPESRGMRSSPVVHPDARTAYEAKLKGYQERADAAHERLARKSDPLLSVVPGGKNPDKDPPSEVTVFRAELAIGAYVRETAWAEKLTHFAVDRLKNNSIDAGTNYPKYVDENDMYKESLMKLELLEGIMLSSLERVRETNAELLSRPECNVEIDRIHELNERAHKAKAHRLEKGVWFVREAKDQVQYTRVNENTEIAAKLGEKGVIALTYPEQLAIHEVNLPISTGGTIMDRLNGIPQLSRRGPDGYMVGVYRFKGFRSKDGDNILLGDLKRTVKTLHVESDGWYDDAAYIPLNSEAIRFFSGTQLTTNKDISRYGLVTLSDDEVDDLERVRFDELRP